MGLTYPIFTDQIREMNEQSFYDLKILRKPLWQVQNSNLRPLGHEPSELTNCSNLRCVQPRSHERAACEN